MKQLHALVTEVTETVLGATVARAHASGEFNLELSDVTDFDEAGGSVFVGGVTYTYNRLNDDTNVLTLATALTTALTDEDYAEVSPQTIVRIAHCAPNEREHPGDTIAAVVPYALFDRIPLGERGNDAEWIEVRDDGLGWYVHDVLGQRPVVSGADVDVTDAPMSDGKAPASSPVPTVRGGPGFLAAEWSPVENIDAVTYEVHVRAEGGVAAKHGETQGTVHFIRAMPDGTALAYDTNYYVSIVAKDPDGSAPISAESTATQLVRVNTPDIAVNAIAAENILAGAITSEKLNAIIGVFGTIRAGEELKQRVEITRSGIELRAQDNNVLASLPTDAAQNPYFKAVLEALGLDVTGSATFRGATTMSTGAALDLKSGVSDPTTAPTLTRVWDSDTFPTTENDFTRFDFEYDPNGGAAGNVPSFYVIEYASNGRLLEVRASDRVVTRSVRIGTGRTPVGVCRQTGANTIWVLFRNADSTTYYLGAITQSTLVMASTGSPIAQLAYPDYSDQNGVFGLAWNGTDLCVQRFDSGGGGLLSSLYLNRYTTARALVSADYFKDIAGDNIYQPRGLTYTGGKYYFLTSWKHAGVTKVGVLCALAGADRSVNTNSRRIQDEFECPSNTHGVAHDGTRFWSLAQSATRSQHTTWTAGLGQRSPMHMYGSDDPGAGFEATHMFSKYTWYKNDGTAQSKGSPNQTLSDAQGLRFAKARLTTPAIPAGADRVRAWAKLQTSATAPAESAYELQATASTVVVDLSDYTEAPTDTIPATSSFPAGTPAVVRNAGGKKLLRADEEVQPIGAVEMYAGSTAPTGWLLCDGAAVSRTTYADLFAVIGTTYGTGDGSTTFNVPNLKGRVPVGLDAAQAEFDALGETGGATTHTLTTAELPSHAHSINRLHRADTVAYSHGHDGAETPSVAAGVTEVGGRTSDTATSNNTGGGGAHNNLQPYVVLNYIIKT